VTVSQTTGGTTVDLTNDLPNDPIQFVPPSVTATPPRYDLDGNLLSDGRWTYTWDGENRLVKMVSIAWTQPSGGYLANATFPAITLEFAYDGLSRRVQKKTITSGTPTMEGYLYDGWNVLMISNLDPANGAHLARKWSCVWRPDVGSRLYARGSWQAAGGVGGLAWLQTGLAQTATMYTYQSVSGNAEVHIPMMNYMGNVRHYYQIKTTGSAGPSPATVTGQVTANLDYDAFGREVRATGTKTPASGQPPGLAPGEPWVDNLPFHFSTKFTDRESGLNYYGYRFYDPVDGRWASRDPIEEEGGINLYGMVGNDAVNRGDVLGLAEITGTTTPGGIQTPEGLIPGKFINKVPTNCFGFACNSAKEPKWPEDASEEGTDKWLKDKTDCEPIECTKKCPDGKYMMKLFLEPKDKSHELFHAMRQGASGAWGSVLGHGNGVGGPLLTGITDPSAHNNAYYKALRKKDAPKFKEKCYCC
jgi:RHS repeat-associated protein